MLQHLRPHADQSQSQLMVFTINGAFWPQDKLKTAHMLLTKQNSCNILSDTCGLWLAGETRNLFSISGSVEKDGERLCPPNPCACRQLPPAFADVHMQIIRRRIADTAASPESGSGPAPCMMAESSGIHDQNDHRESSQAVQLQICQVKAPITPNTFQAILAVRAK